MKTLLILCALLAIAGLCFGVGLAMMFRFLSRHVVILSDGSLTEGQIKRILRICREKRS